MSVIALAGCLILIAACASDNKVVLPPGIERGMLWGTEYGYEDVYAMPDKLPEAKKGNRFILKSLNNAVWKNPCKQKSRLYIQIIIDEAGDISDKFVRNPTGEPCEAEALKALNDIKFYPAKYEGKNVKAVFTVSAVMPSP